MKALITGITGQDGSYLADFLLEKGYEVHGVVRRLSTPNTENIFHLIDRVTLHEGDLTDVTSLTRIVDKVKPDEVYNLAAQSFVGASWNQPILTANIDAIGALNVYEAVRLAHPEAKVYQASTSEMFSGEDYPQTECTPFRPRSPYGVSKLFAHEMARVYKESYGMHISCGILFNHESPRRGIEFVTRKVVAHAVGQSVSDRPPLKIGNIEAKRDWSHAKDMVRGMWMMLQQEEPDDYIMSSGTTTSVKEFIDEVYKQLGMPLKWDFTYEYPKAKFTNSVCKTLTLVESVPEFYRPNEVNVLQGVTFKAKEKLGWEPEFTLEDLIADMIESEKDLHW